MDNFFLILIKNIFSEVSNISGNTNILSEIFFSDNSDTHVLGKFDVKEYNNLLNVDVSFSVPPSYKWFIQTTFFFYT